MRPKILVVDDEPEAVELVEFNLKAAGFDVLTAADGAEALKKAHAALPGLVVLDLMLPEVDGLEVCKMLRRDPATATIPIVMVTAKAAEIDRILGLELGADDYITKPFKLRELTARLHAVLRRTQIQAATEPKVLEIGNLKIDLNGRLFWRDDEEIHLSPKEFDLLAFMMKNAGFPLTHLKLLRTIWGPEYGGELEYLRSYVRMLRKKIETDPENPQYILTEPWLGYRFRDAADAEPH